MVPAQNEGWLKEKHFIRFYERDKPVRGKIVLMVLECATKHFQGKELTCK